MPTAKSLKRSFLTFGQPDITEEEIQAVTDVLRSQWIGTGRVTRQLEEEFVRYMGGGYAVAVSSCSIGLAIALKSVGVCHGSNVLTTPLTFCATVNAIIQVGARPLFSDVNEDGILDKRKFRETFLVKNQLRDGEEKWTLDYKRPDCILPVNYLGASARFFPGDKWTYPVIEDAAHSFGGDCGYGDLTVFSFYATKNITSGEGGMIWTRKKELADRCRLLSNQGQSNGAWGRYSSGPIENYEIVHPGFKGNLPDILSAIALVQLRRWPELRKKRDAVWGVYAKAFGVKGFGHAKHLYTIQVKKRAKIREELYNRGIGTGIHYEALHLQPAYHYLGYKKGDFPMAEKIGEETLSLPISAKMTPEDAEYVVQSLKEIL